MMVTSVTEEGQQLKKIIEGKTKIVYEYGSSDPDLVRIVMKDDITAGDGARRDSFEGKGRLSNLVNANVFECLHSCGIPVAFRGRHSDSDYIASRCDMILVEAVARRIAYGSYLKRNPDAKEGKRFDALVIEFFLKTTGKKIGAIDLPTDDPLIVAFWKDGMNVRRADMTAHEATNISISGDIVYGGNGQYPFKRMEELTRRVFLVLEKVWADLTFTLYDLKIEFGIDRHGELLVADVITPDEWRLVDHMGEHYDKQRYRDGDEIANVAKFYEEVTQLTKDFPYQPRGTIVLWRGSKDDPKEPFEKELERLGNPAYFAEAVCSMHKQTKQCLETLSLIEREAGTRDCVIIAYVGLSNGLGPGLKGNTMLPVISVPIDERDVWSSLRLPSNLPALTVLNPKNAVQAALDILALRSPHAYMARRYVMEEKWLDRNNSPSIANDGITT